MRSNSSVVYAFFLVIGDFLALLAAFSVAYVLRVTYDPRPLVNQISAIHYIQAFATVLPLWVLIHGFIGLYSAQIYEKRFVEFGRLFVGSFLGILTVIGYDFVVDGELFPARLVPVYGVGLAFAFLVSFRSLARIIRTELFAFNVGITRLLIVGNTPLSVELLKELRDSKTTGYKVLGLVGVDPNLVTAHAGVKVFSDFKTAVDTIGVGNIQSIIQTELFAGGNKNNEILTTAQENHIAYRFVPGNSELFVGNIQVDLFRGVPVIAVHQTALLGWGRIVKRIFDLLFGVIFLMLALPLMALIAIAIKIGDPAGPVFMRGVQQNRLTRFNHIFKVYKFRSHYAKFDGIADKEVFEMIGRPELYDEYMKNGNVLKNDIRVTPVGRFIRKFSLDELPQLINVVKGDISLVGPRALLPNELNVYKKKHVILSVKSGLTGLAVVSGRSSISFDERRKLDLFYAQNWSFWLDLVILVKTVGVVLRAKGSR